MAVIAVALAFTLVVVDLLVERALIDDTAARLELEAGLIAPTSPGRGNAPITSLAPPDLARALGGQQTAVVILDSGGSTVASEANGSSQAVLDARLDPGTYHFVAASGGTVDRVLDLDGTTGRVLIVPSRSGSRAARASTATARATGTARDSAVVSAGLEPQVRAFRRMRSRNSPSHSMKRMRRSAHSVRRCLSLVSAGSSPPSR